MTQLWENTISMELTLITILIAVILLQFVFIIYQDRMARDEREKLMLKFMSKDITEYSRATTPEPEDGISIDVTENHMDLEDVPLETLLKAQDKL